VLRFTPLLADAAHAVGMPSASTGSWMRPYVKVAGRWRYLDRAIDQSRQALDVVVAPRRDARAALRFFQRAIGTTRMTPVEVVIDHAPVYPGVLGELALGAWHRTDQSANSRVEADHGE
jgi:transposase-like protein